MRFVKIVITGLLCVVAGTVMAQDSGFKVGVDAASAYVFRGATLNDGLVLQPRIEAEISAFTVGVWGNFDINDYGGALERYQFSEIDIYASFALPVEFMDVSIDYCEYTYPGAEGRADRELALGLGLDILLSPSLMIAYGLDGGIEKSLYMEFGSVYALELTKDFSMELGAALGYLHPDDGESGFSHYSTTLGLNMGPASASVTYVGRIDKDVLGESYDVEVYGMLGLTWAF